MADTYTISNGTPIGSAAGESSRWATGCVTVIPAAEGRVVIAATDCRILAITDQPGTLAGPALLPAKPFAKPGKIAVNGRVERSNSRGKVECVEDLPADPGRFPAAHDVIPRPTVAGTLTVRIDAELLRTLASAITSADARKENGLAVTLHIPLDGESAIAVRGSDGIGVLMPLERDILDGPSRYCATADRYAADIKAGLDAIWIARASRKCDAPPDAE